jgi:hypothetical protein
MKNLGKIKDLLSREEMKQIQGGSGGSGGATCFCNNGPKMIGGGCSWCGQVCAMRGGYKGVCIEW